MNELVIDHIARCKRLTDDQIDALSDAWKSREDHARIAPAAEVKKLSDAWGKAEANARKNAGDELDKVMLAIIYAILFQAGSYSEVIKRAFWSPRIVGVALLAKEKIWGPEFELLVEPWVSVMGRTFESV